MLSFKGEFQMSYFQDLLDNPVVFCFINFMSRLVKFMSRLEFGPKFKIFLL